MRQNKFALISALLSAVAVSLLVALLTGRTGSVSTIIATALQILIVTTGLLAALVVAYRRLTTVRKRQIRIALAGLPGAGKTVFVNVAFGLLMEGNNAHWEFTSETRTAHSVYSTIRRLGQGTWPKSTTCQGFALYQGNVQENQVTLLSALRRGVQEYELELADSAGEFWEELGDADPDAELGISYGGQLPSSSFIQYLLNCDSVLYFIDARSMLVSSGRIRSAVDDLLNTVQFLRSIRSRRSAPVSVSVLLSMVDLLSDDQAQVVQSLFRPGEFSTEEVFSDDSPSEFSRSVLHLERLVAVLPRVARVEKFEMVSSLSAALDGKIAGDLSDPDDWPIRHVAHGVDGLLSPVLRAIAQPDISPMVETGRPRTATL